MGFFDFFKKKQEEDVFRKVSVDELIKQNSLDAHETPTFQTPYGEEKNSEDQNMIHNNLQQHQMPQSQFPQEHSDLHEKTRQRFQDMGISTQRSENLAQPPQTQQSDRMLELLNAKLDAISAKLDSLGQRVGAIEREINKRW